jgi:twinkle protein
MGGVTFPKGIFITTDDPSYLERSVEPDKVLVDLADQNIAELRSEYIRRQRDYFTTPFDPEGHKLRLFPGGITIWSGFPGSGKTTMLRQLACHLMARPCGVFFASLEEDPRDLIVRIAECAVGREEPSETELEWFLFEYGERLKLWGQIGRADYHEIFALIRLLAKQGVRHAIIDSLFCLNVSPKDMDAQQQFAADLATTARLSGCHIHLVAHPRKPQQSDQDVDLNDVAGSADLGRIVDNVVFVKRSKNEASISDDVRPMAVAIRKQRHGTGATGDITGWFHRPMRQFHRDQFASYPTRYLPNEAYASHGSK